jgi:2-oxoglutarate dehydrogenase E1 component
MDNYSYISNADPAYIDNLYQAYQQDPNSVDETWQRFFEGFNFSIAQFGEEGKPSLDADTLEKEIAVRKLIDAYRAFGHLEATTNPIRTRKDRKAGLELSNFNLNEKDLETVFQAGNELGMGTAKLKDIIAVLTKIYKGGVGFEYTSLRTPELWNWFKDKVEKEFLNFKPTLEEKKRILYKLNEAVVFESFLGTKYLGKKRFSLEGGEATISAMDTIIDVAGDFGVEEIIVGMAHRGRLNILANILGKPYSLILEEFEGKAAQNTLGDGDVKYHMGWSSTIKTQKGQDIEVKLLPNPSHLEAVDPVVHGFARAKIDELGGVSEAKSKILPILFHGDAAVAGQGIIYEILQMSNLPGYDVGGTIHFIINNQVGFTTDFDDARSSMYATDISQISETPEIHVNGDDPEAVMFAVKVAVEFREKFNRDIFIDMVCYRRHGHNEADEPRFTQPKLYNLIQKHPNPRDIYNDILVKNGDIPADYVKKLDKEFRSKLQTELDDVRKSDFSISYQNKKEKAWEGFRRSLAEDFLKSPQTGVAKANIEKVAKALAKLPEGFNPLRQVTKLIAEREVRFFGAGKGANTKEKSISKKLDWAAAELLAYGSILLEGNKVRFTGEDVQRGTFSHRHAVLKDGETNEAYTNLNHIEEGQGELDIYNSLLSEYGVLGFEYGYAMAAPNALVIWEAQFGDFANGAQIMIDQFVASGESKWDTQNGLLMLLPHGYEGQGPEHSNARPERYLQLYAKYNMTVTNVTTPANLFHLIRRQMVWEFRKPCMLMTPKSMLRHPECVSDIKEFVKGNFQEVIGDKTIKKTTEVKKVLLCSGKIYYDLLKKQRDDKRTDVAIIRVEQLAPFPIKQVDAQIKKYKNAQSITWVQEEPANMGAWTHILLTYRKDLDLVSRAAGASPATGFNKVHIKEQIQLVEEAFKLL